MRLLIEEQTHKICASCKEDLPITSFDKHGKHTAGVTRYESYCKKCTGQRRCSQDNIIMSILSSAKCKAKRKGWEFSIDGEFVNQLNEKQAGLCAISGVVLSWDEHITNSKEKSCFCNCPSTRASLDRKDSSKGYTKDNVHLVCAFVNLAKSTHSIEEFIRYCKLIADYNK